MHRHHHTTIQSEDHPLPAKTFRRFFVSLLLLAVAAPLAAQALPARPAYSAEECSSCAEWNAPQRPFRILGNTYFVGTRGLSAILVTSGEGHVLIDGALPESVPQILESIRSLGFRVEDVRLILNSHAHFDHAGGIAELQRATGAAVAASPASAAVLKSGTAGPDDPQYGVLLAYPAVPEVRVLSDGETLRVGGLALTAHFTRGHTRGGTSWSWRSCDDAGLCAAMVYADSQTPVSAEGFLFSRNPSYPGVVDDFRRGHALLERLPCDVLLTPHPFASRIFERVEVRDRRGEGALLDPEGCRRYAATSREQLERRLATERDRR